MYVVTRPPTEIPTATRPSIHNTGLGQRAVLILYMHIENCSASFSCSESPPYVWGAGFCGALLRLVLLRRWSLSLGSDPTPLPPVEWEYLSLFFADKVSKHLPSPGLYPAFVVPVASAHFL